MAKLLQMHRILHRQDPKIVSRQLFFTFNGYATAKMMISSAMSTRMNIVKG
jgi:hypothetical protein